MVKNIISKSWNEIVHHVGVLLKYFNILQSEI